MGRFSHLLDGKVTPVTRGYTPRVTGKPQSFQRGNTGYTGYTEKQPSPEKHHETAKENFNDGGCDPRSEPAPLARELSIQGVTGVTGVTALKNNGFSGYTSFFEGVTGVTALKNNGFSGCVQAQEGTSDVVDLAEIRSAVAYGDPKLIEAAVNKYPDLAERAAIREFEGGFDRAAAEWHALQDLLDEVGHDA
jgi:hypothetical protein